LADDVPFIPQFPGVALSATGVAVMIEGLITAFFFSESE
jgi:hypothetical protein